MIDPLSRRLAAEALGTALLVAIVVGSGIMAERLAGGSAAVALLANTLATMAGLCALIQTFGPVSGAHFNPVVSLALASRGDLPWTEVPGYAAAQLAGGIAGTAGAHLMFEMPVLTAGTKLRDGLPLVLSEAVATFGLLGVIWIASRRNASAVPGAVAGWIGAAYWFTASTSFANPAVTIARALTDSFAGIRPADVPGFLLGQAFGTAGAIALFGWMAGRTVDVEDRR